MMNILNFDNRQTWKNIFSSVLLLLLCAGLFSCGDDEKNEPEAPIEDDYFAMAQELLQDSIVLNAHAMMSIVNKTKLPTGCPLKYYFTWRDDGLLRIELRNFTVGKMPLTIWFSINVKFMQLNTWEKQEYTDEGWLKFKGEKGMTSYSPNMQESQYEAGTGGNGTVIGYLNVLTGRIEFSTEFNVMLVQAYVFEQTIDKSRIYRYDEEIRKFAQDLIKWKEEHGE
ncbi:MAG: DUF4903 family protein [Prevotellaceae bacterium]|jgi:hypothetical protein|nr:DUF4903 family protein [Prevotellaceae bacterium]